MKKKDMFFESMRGEWYSWNEYDCFMTVMQDNMRSKFQREYDELELVYLNEYAINGETQKLDKLETLIDDLISTAYKFGLYTERELMDYEPCNIQYKLDEEMRKRGDRDEAL